MLKLSSNMELAFNLNANKSTNQMSLISTIDLELVIKGTALDLRTPPNPQSCLICNGWVRETGVEANPCILTIDPR